MGRKSSFRFLPQEIVTEIDRLLSEDRATLDEILEHLRDLGVDSVSRSALGRRRQRMEKVVERLRQSREMTAMIVDKLGPDAVEGRQGRSLVQLLQAMISDYLMRRMDEPDAEFEVKELLALGRTLRDTAQASRTSQDFELKIREQIEREAKAKMEKAVEAVVGASEGRTLDAAAMKKAILEVYGAGG